MTTNIGIIGVGRLGLCFALLCERAGYKVMGSDVREEYVTALNNKNITTNEPKVSELLTASSNFTATTDNLEVINTCDIIYTLVATPSLDDGSYDVSSIWQVVEDFKRAGHSVSGKSLVIGCTTNPGDCDKFQAELQSYNVTVYYNPEFIAQGSIIKDLEHADMVLIGGSGQHLNEIKDIYHKIQVTEPKICVMSNKAAEITKIAVNCFLTTKISYANMLGQVLTRSGMESEIGTVLTAVGSDTRVGSKYMRYGFGFGGPCLPRDNRAFGAYMKSLGMENNLGTTSDNFNNDHAMFLRYYFLSKNAQNLPFYFEYISYKPGTNILTESQQLRLCCDLLNHGCKVYIRDLPEVIAQVSDTLVSKYGDRVVFLDETQNIPEEVYNIIM